MANIAAARLMFRFSPVSVLVYQMGGARYLGGVPDGTEETCSAPPPCSLGVDNLPCSLLCRATLRSWRLRTDITDGAFKSNLLISPPPPVWLRSVAPIESVYIRSDVEQIYLRGV